MSFVGLLLLILIIIMLMLLLIRSSMACSLATLGLTLWFEHMIPVLLPFMMITGIMTALNLHRKLIKPLVRPFRRLFHVSESGAYCICMGLLCGFPMGAHCIADLCNTQKMSASEGRFLIPYCNLIGPVYFFSFALEVILPNTPSLFQIFLLGFGMYGTPMLLCALDAKMHRRVSDASTEPESGAHTAVSLIDALETTIPNTMSSIIKLCGYMILFNVLMLPVYTLADGRLTYIPAASMLHCLVEISGGLSLCSTLPTYGSGLHLTALFMLTMLSFGGLCCFAQTLGYLRMIQMKPMCYLGRKLVIAFATGVYDLLILRFFF